MSEQIEKSVARVMAMADQFALYYPEKTGWHAMAQRSDRVEFERVLREELLATQPQAPQGGGFKGPNKWTDEEVADGHRGIRWITTEGVQGRPTSHDLMGYLKQRGEAAYCDCLQCKSFFAPTETPEAGK